MDRSDVKRIMERMTVADLHAILNDIDSLTAERDSLLSQLTAAREDARRARLVASDAGMEEIERLTAELAEVTSERDGLASVARRVVSRSMHHRTPDRDTFLRNDVEILAKLSESVEAIDAALTRKEQKNQ